MIPSLFSTMINRLNKIEHWQSENFRWFVFHFQCERCLCWSHCECVGVTTSCIPTFFKCHFCTKAEGKNISSVIFSYSNWLNKFVRLDERVSIFSPYSMFDDETTFLLLNSSVNSDKILLFFSHFRRLWNLRERIIELKFRSTPIFRLFEHCLR